MHGQRGWKHIRKRRIRHAEKLIGLGLAELIFGEPGLTGGGHRVLALIAA